MTRSKRVLSLVLIVVLMVSMLAIPAFAASDVWVQRFQQFPTITTGTTNYGYVKALQTFLLAASDKTAALIREGGGVDGGYGAKTKDAVKLFQMEVFPNDSSQWDGATGSKTWGRIAAWLEVIQYSSTQFTFISFAQDVYRVTVNNGVYTYAYNSSDGWKTFRQV
ncbi:MAG: hypothetical protein IJZ68_14275 [Bacteroidaceae bacterium]|nr:hypothetical protein [Bacteroidaceae bacterium]